MLLVIDGSQPLTPEDLDIAASVGNKTALVVVNKCDLPAFQPSPDQSLLAKAPRVFISALTGQGVDELEQTMADVILGGQVMASDAPLVTSPRHQALLSAAADRITAAIEGYELDRADLVAIDVRDAVDLLGEITGETAGEDLLEAIFSRFCIGK